ncbi:MAG: hypothetical protein WAV16_02230 [Candidatus Moraniibacteriota bacterium]
MNRDTFTAENSGQSSAFFEIFLKVVFWWPILLIKVILDKTTEIHMSCAILSLGAFFTLVLFNKSLILYGIVYFFLGAWTVRRDFWT